MFFKNITKLIIYSLYLGFICINTSLELNPRLNQIQEKQLQKTEKPLFITRNQILNQSEFNITENLPIISGLNLLSNKKLELSFEQEDIYISIYNKEGMLFAKITLTEPTAEQAEGKKHYAAVVSRDILEQREINVQNFEADGKFRIEMYCIFLQPTIFSNKYYLNLVQSLTLGWEENYAALIKSGFIFKKDELDQIDELYSSRISIVKMYSLYLLLSERFEKFFEKVERLKNLGRALSRMFLNLGIETDQIFQFLYPHFREALAFTLLVKIIHQIITKGVSQEFHGAHKEMSSSDPRLYYLYEFNL